MAVKRSIATATLGCVPWYPGTSVLEAYMRRRAGTRISLDSSQGYQLPTKTYSGQISWYLWRRKPCVCVITGL